jgi:hypothetical protein
MKICSKCKMEKDDIAFSPAALKNKYGKCKECISLINKQWSLKHPEVASKKAKKWRQKNPQKASEDSKKWRKNNPEKAKEASIEWKVANPEKVRKAARRRSKRWREKNPEKVKEGSKRYKKENPEKINTAQRKRYQEDPIYRIHKVVSASIHRALKQNGGSKNGKSCFKYLSWTAEELRAYLLECMKQPGNEWMNENNQGSYNLKTWDDNNPETWTWQLDHIIPQSTFNYTSMDSQEFRDCWALSNLRPYSAKQNLLDGVTRIRHLTVNT